MIEHVLSKHDLLDVKLPEPEKTETAKAKGKQGKNKETFKRYFDYSSDLQTLMNAVNDANDIIKLAASNKHKVIVGSLPVRYVPSSSITFMISIFPRVSSFKNVN